MSKNFPSKWQPFLPNHQRSMHSSSILMKYHVLFSLSVVFVFFIIAFIYVTGSSTCFNQSFVFLKNLTAENFFLFPPYIHHLIGWRSDFSAISDDSSCFLSQTFTFHIVKSLLFSLNQALFKNGMLFYIL